MNKLICKPCLAFDALGSLIFCNYCRGDIPDIKEWVLKTYNGLHIGPSNKFFDVLVSHHSLSEIESFDIDKLIDVYYLYIDENEYIKRFEVDILKGLQILKNSNFMEIWINKILPILNKQCNEFISVCDENIIENVMTDVCRVHQKKITDDICVYMTYFMYPVSFNLTLSSYLTNNAVDEELSPKHLIQWFAHELSHRFSDERSKSAYREAYQKDKYFNKANWFLSNIVGAPGDEEEFVQAIEHAIAVKNGLETYDDAMNRYYSWYKCSVPIAIILFSELNILNEIPIDMNEWIYSKFNDGTIKIGEIENKINSLIFGYTDRFTAIWEEEKLKNPDKFTSYNNTK